MKNWLAIRSYQLQDISSNLNNGRLLICEQLMIIQFLILIPDS